MNLCSRGVGAARILATTILAITALPAFGQTRPDATLPGKAVYDKACATCHATPAEPRIPTFGALTVLPAGTLRDAMVEGGKMAPMAAGLSDFEKTQLVAYLTS